MRTIKIAVIDDEINPLKSFVENIIDKPDVQCSYFMRDPKALLESVAKDGYDAVFLDINMPAVNGVDLACRILEKAPDVCIAFISGYAQDEEKIGRRVGENLIGFCYKPYSAERIDEFVARIKQMRGIKCAVYARTFGNFDLFVDGEKVEFESQKSKEFLAYLVDRRGATVPMSEMVTALWPSRPLDKAKMLYRNAKSRLDITLRNAGMQNLVRFGRAQASVNPDLMECDMWRYIDDDSDMSYNGEYMISYNWSVNTQHRLDMIAMRRDALFD